MSKRGGLFVFTATPEMAQALPKIFKKGETYIAQRADTVIAAAGGTESRKTAPAGQKKAAKAPAKKAGRPAKAKAPVKAPVKTPAKSGKVGRPRKNISPEVVVQFVRDNEGCNMTQIEAAVKMPQAAIRKALNDAREAGQIRTEGQRRGLRYYPTTSVAAATADQSGQGSDAQTPW